MSSELLPHMAAYFLSHPPVTLWAGFVAGDPPTEEQLIARAFDWAEKVIAESERRAKAKRDALDPLPEPKPVGP